MPRSNTLPAFTLVLAALCAVPMAPACRTTQPAREQMHDSEITTKVKAKFMADPEVSSMNIAVETNEGVVYLMGRVKDLRQKQEAERLARSTEGVHDVVNHLNVGDQT